MKPCQYVFGLNTENIVINDEILLILCMVARLELFHFVLSSHLRWHLPLTTQFFVKIEFL